MNYRWATSGVTLTLWIDGVQALQVKGAKTKASAHTVVEMYSKWYGASNGGGTWGPSPAVRYTRNVRVASGRIWPAR
jgi:hypothetical protein